MEYVTTEVALSPLSLKPVETQKHFSLSWQRGKTTQSFYTAKNPSALNNKEKSNKMPTDQENVTYQDQEKYEEDGKQLMHKKIIWLILNNTSSILLNFLAAAL